MTRQIVLLIFSIANLFCFGQIVVHNSDSLKRIDSLLQDLPNSRRGNQYVKYKLDFSNNSDLVKIISQSYDFNTNEKINQNNAVAFHLSDIDPEAILIRAYNSANVMVQLICKENRLLVTNIFSYEGKEMSSSKLDRASISSYDPTKYMEKLECIRNAFIFVVTSSQNNTNERYRTDTTDMKTVLQKSGGKEQVVDLSKMKGNKGHFVFGMLEVSPVFQNSKNEKETEINARNFLIEKAKNEKHESKGKVFISFVINEEGKVGEIQILKGINKELDNLAIKIVKSMPKWTPGMNSGKKVATKIITNIEF